jgi:pimeloyl-ACP methyl ester carboxylesterase
MNICYLLFAIPKGNLVSKALVNGITIGYDDVGDGPDVLVLVHGHPFDRSMWRPQVEDWRCPGGE